MAITNQERIGKALELLKDGLRPFVEREMKAQHAQRWFAEMKASAGDTQGTLFGTEAAPRWDAAVLLSVMSTQRNGVFAKTLGRAEECGQKISWNGGVGRDSCRPRRRTHRG